MKTRENNMDTIIENINIEKLIKIFKLDQPKVNNYVTQVLNSYYSEVTVGNGYVYAQGTIPVLLVAHMDTVHKETPKKFETDDKRETLSSPQGIGGDDRNGIYAILEIIKTHKCSVLFCEDEEIGGVGAGKFIKTKLANKLKKEKIFKYLIELDRQGSDDAVFYDCDNPEFTEFITKDFWRERYGSFSDISTLAPYLECAAVNLSCGYYKAHTVNEYIVFSELDQCIKQVRRLLDRSVGIEQFKYIEAEYNYGGYYGGYGLDYEDENGYEDYYDPTFVIEYLSREKIGTAELSALREAKIKASSETEAIGKFMIQHQDICYRDITNTKEKKWWEIFK